MQPSYCSAFHYLPFISYFPIQTQLAKQLVSCLELIKKFQRRNKFIKYKKIHARGRYIYMYDLPRRFNHHLLTKCPTLSQWFNFRLYVKNEGFGPRLNDKSWYTTNRFMLSVIFHNRMKKYECLASSSLIASTIYPPFYPGEEVGRFL